MQVRATPFALQGCRCRLKSDPKELQRLLVERVEQRFGKENKLNKTFTGAISVSGQFLDIDEGNLALHLLCAFLGKPRIVCEATVAVDDDVLWKERIETSSSGTCFHSMRALLKADVDLLAHGIVARTTRALKAKRVS